MRAAAELHDVGKLALPEAILAKPGPLDDEEWELVREHTLIGERIIAAGEGLDPVARIVRSTHERWDGTGYPDGLARRGDPARRTDHRDLRRLRRDDHDANLPGRAEHDEAVDELRESAGTQFDPELVETFILRALPALRPKVIEPDSAEVAAARGRG